MKQYNNRKFQHGFTRYHTAPGFTLIELLVSIVIVGILATSLIAVLNPLEQIKKTRDSQRKHDFDQLRKSLEISFIENDSYPAADGEQIKDAHWGKPWLPYMPRVPKDPLSTQSYRYEVADDKSWYRLYAKLENCKDPQKMPNAQCGFYNYSVTSPNIIVALLPTPTPTPTPRPFKYVFVTSGAYTGDLKTQGAGGGLDPGLDGGDNICKSLADNSTIVSVRGLTWKAWLSNSSTNAVERIYPPGTENTEYRLVDNTNTTVVANDRADLIDGTLNNPINSDENRNAVTSSVWTGTEWSGLAHSATCIGWTSTGSNGFTGISGSSIFSWSAERGLGCSTSLRLYCFEQ